MKTLLVLFLLAVSLTAHALPRTSGTYTLSPLGLETGSGDQAPIALETRTGRHDPRNCRKVNFFSDFLKHSPKNRDWSDGEVFPEADDRRFYPAYYRPFL